MPSEQLVSVEGCAESVGACDSVALGSGVSVEASGGASGGAAGGASLWALAEKENAHTVSTVDANRAMRFECMRALSFDLGGMAMEMLGFCVPELRRDGLWGGGFDEWGSGLQSDRERVLCVDAGL